MSLDFRAHTKKPKQNTCPCQIQQFLLLSSFLPPKKPISWSFYKKIRFVSLLNIMIPAHSKLCRYFWCHQVQRFMLLKCVLIQWSENKNIWGKNKVEKQHNCIFKGIICSTLLLVIIFCSGLQRFCFWHLISFTAASNWIRIIAEQQENLS